MARTPPDTGHPPHRVLYRGQRVRVEGYRHPDAVVAANSRGPFVPVVVSGTGGPRIHQVPFARLTPSEVPGPDDVRLRRFLHSPAARFAAAPAPASAHPARPPHGPGGSHHHPRHVHLIH